MSNNKGIVEAINMLRDENRYIESSDESRHQEAQSKRKQLSDVAEGILERLKGDALQKEENDREQKLPSKPTAPESPNVPEFGGFKDLKGVFATIAGVVAAFGGFVSGYVSKVLSLFKINFGGGGKFFKTIVTKLKSFGQSVKTLFSPIASFFGKIKTILEPITNVFKGAGKFGKAAKVFAGNIGKVFGVFKTLGRFVALPLTIIMSLIDGVKGAMSAFEKRKGGMFNKIIAALVGFVGGIVSGFVGGILDMAKGAISWIAGALGFDGIEKSLDSFSFSSMITDVFDRFTDGLIRIKEYIFSMFDFGDMSFGEIGASILLMPGRIIATVVGVIGDFFKDLTSDILRFFGAESSADALDSFSIAGIIDSAFVWLSKIPDKIIKSITEWGGAISNGIGMAWDAMTNFDFIGAFKEGINFLATAPYKLIGWVFDKLKDGISALFAMTGNTDISGELDSFSFSDVIDNAIAWVKKLPMRIWDSMVSLGNSIDDGSLMEDVTNIGSQIMAKFKSMVRDMLPTPDSMAGKFVPDSVYEWVGVEPKPTLKFKESAGVKSKEELVDVRASFDKDQAELKARVMARRALRTSVDKPAVMATKALDNQNTEHRKNTESGGGVNVVAPMSNSTVNNSNSTTAAVIDQNVSTRDMNDRSWGNMSVA